MLRSSTTKREAERVRVSVRVRPLDPREQSAVEGGSITVAASAASAVVTVTPVGISNCHDAKAEGNIGNRKSTQEFQFDHVFWSVDKPDAAGGSPATQADVFEAIGSPLVRHAFDGFNSCLFAYGQTGSGKTYTMMGADVNALGGEGSGVTPRICLEIFARKASIEAEGHSRWLVELGYVEVYNERVSDLLGRRKKGARATDEVYVEVREHPSRGVFLEGQRLVEVACLDDVVRLLEAGNGVRHTAATKMNDRSSRSHAIIMLLLREERTMTTRTGETIKTAGKSSRMNLVDLAGSERVAQSQVEGQQFKEATHINLSLTTLGRVIDALADMAKRGARAPAVVAPFRDSKLTFILKDSLGGNSKTSMLATVSPSAINYEETLSTLRYASRARDIVTVAQVNEDPRARRIRELEEQMASMRQNMAGGDPAYVSELEEKLALLESEAQKRAADLQALEKERQKNEIRDLMLKATEAERLELLEKADLLEQQVADTRAQADRMEEENRRVLALHKEKEALLRAREASLEKYRHEMRRRESSMENHREKLQMSVEAEQVLRQVAVLELREAEERNDHDTSFFLAFLRELRRAYGAMIRDALEQGVQRQTATMRELEEMTDTAKSHEKENGALKTSLAQYERDVADLRRSLEEADIELKKVTAAADAAEEQHRVDNKNAEGQLSSVTLELEKASREAAVAQQELDVLRQRFESTQQEVERAKQATEAVEREKECVQSALDGKTAEANATVKALDDLRSHYEVAKEQLEGAHQSLSAADHTNENLRKELSTATAEIDALKAASDELLRNMEATTHQLSQAKAQHAAVLDTLALQEKENLSLSTQLLQIKEAQETLEQQLAEQQRVAEELASFDERWNLPADNAPTTTSTHTKTFPGGEWSIILQEKPRELDRTFREDVALACHVCPTAIANVAFTLGSLHATFSVRHPATVSAEHIALRLDVYPFRGMEQLYKGRHEPSFGLDALANENEFLRSQHTGDHEKYDSLYQHHQQITRELHTAVTEKERLQSELEEKGSEADAAKEDNETLRGQLEEAQQQIEEVSAEMERMTLLIEGKAAEVNDSKQRNSVLRGQLEEANAESQRVVELLVAKESEAVAERSRLEVLLREKDLEANTVKRGNSVLRGNVEEAMAEKSRLDALLRERNQEVDAARRVIAGLRDELQSSSAEKERLRLLLDDKRREVAAVLRELSATQGQLAVATEEKVALTSKLTRSAAETCAVAERCAKAESEWKRLEAELGQLQSALRKLERDKAKLREGYEESERGRRRLDARFEARREHLQGVDLDKAPTEALTESVEGRFKMTRKAMQALNRNAA